MLDMGIIKVEVNLPELRETFTKLTKQRRELFEVLTVELKSAASFAINELMNAEMTVFLGKPDQAGNKRNGYKTKDYSLKGIGGIQVRVPQDRRNCFEYAEIWKCSRIG